MEKKLLKGKKDKIGKKEKILADILAFALSGYQNAFFSLLSFLPSFFTTFLSVFRMPEILSDYTRIGYECYLLKVQKF